VCTSGNYIASVWTETVAYCVAVRGLSGHAGLLLWAPSEFQFAVTLM
jgi:hypothetical protein